MGRLLQGGARSIALPGAAVIHGVFDGVRRILGPVYQLCLRLWLAAAPAGITLAALSPAFTMQPNCKVEAVSATSVVVSGKTIPTRTVLWAAEVMASTAAAWLGVDADRAGRVPVGADLAVPDLDGVYAVGDTAASTG